MPASIDTGVRHSVRDHPGPFGRKRLGTIGRFHRVAFSRTAATAARPVPMNTICRRARRMRAALVGRVRNACRRWHGCQSRRAEQRARCHRTTTGARLRFAVPRQRVRGGKASAFIAGIFIERHANPFLFRFYLSGDIGMSTPPLMCLTGPSAFGITSKSNISVGNHKVAHAFGISTTPLMCPCTGAVPRMA